MTFLKNLHSTWLAYSFAALSTFILLAGCKKNPSEPAVPLARASISVTPDIGTLNTTFLLQVSVLLDGDTSNGQGYQARWDWDGDNAFDTGWLDSLSVQHSYGQLGRKTPTVEIRNPTGATAGAGASLYVQEIVLIANPPSGQSFEYPDWSRDGSNRIVFAVEHTSSVWWDLGLTQYPGGVASIITPDSTTSYLPDWSADGNSVAFTTGGGLGIHNISTTARTTFSPTFDAFPAWSPDGRYIVYGSLMYDLADSSSSSFPFTAEVAWSPGGDTLAIASTPGTLTLVAFPGYAVLRNYSIPDAGMKPEWSPNGKWISLGADNPLLNVATGEVLSWRADGLEFPFCPTWSPDGTLLAFAATDTTSQLRGIWAIRFPQDLY